MSNISAVLPLNIEEAHKSNSCELVDILITSLKKFAAPGLFETFYVVCPPNQVAPISQHMQQHPELPITVVNERDVVPGLKDYVKSGGWRIQQIIKLQAAHFVKTPYYITFDADVVCTHPVSEDTLLPKGKALMQMEPRANHKNWWLSSAYQLGVKPHLKKDGMFVTPAILASEPVKGLITELSTKKDWMEKLLGPHMPGSIQQKLPRFKKKHRWTEYTLYHLYLEKHGLLEQYHVDVSQNPDLPKIVSDTCVWKRENFDNWDAEHCFSDRDNSLFVVIQSNKQIAPAVVRERLALFID